MARLTRCSRQFGDGGAHKGFFGKKISFKQLLWSFASQVSEKGHFAGVAIKATTCSPSGYEKVGTENMSLGQASIAKSFCCL